MALNVDKTKADLKKMGSDASDAYHEKVPVSKRPLFWVAFIIIALIVGSVIGWFL